MPTAAMTQQNRVFTVATELGEDVLLFRSCHGREQLSRPFEFALELISEQPDKVKIDKLLGSNATVAMDMPGGGQRYFNGHISHFAQTSRAGKVVSYHATLSPWLWMLTRASDCRIYQNKSVPDIITSVFRDHGFSDFKSNLSESYKVVEYCVQYHETMFAFVSRLMEQAGIYYYFEHEAGKHTLVMCDSPSAHQAYPGCATVPFRDRAGSVAAEECIFQWSVGWRVRPGKVTLKDYAPATPRDTLLATSSANQQYPNGQYEIYDYPGYHEKLNDGQQRARVRMEALQTTYEQFSARGDAMGLACGHTVTLTNLPQEQTRGEYLIVAADYHCVGNEYGTGGGSQGGGSSFNCGIQVINSQQQFRPQPITPRPVIHGPQTAMVVGPSGSTIYADEHGRVKVQFHWDRYGKSNDESSCFIRVSQLWADKKWGALFTPRVGEEVIVEHLNGDPDRPIITGRVYNGDATPPYDPKQKPTISTIMSQTDGGGGYNELRFNDEGGKEQIYVHAQKDADTYIINDAKTYVGANQHLIVKTDQRSQVKGDRDMEVTGADREKVGGDASLNVTGKRMTKVGGDESLDITGKRATKVGGDESLNVTGKRMTKVGGDESLNITGKRATKVSDDMVDAGGEIYLKAGQKVIIEAGMQLTIKAGSSFIDIGPSGVSIVGTMINLNSGGSGGAGTAASPAAPDAPDTPEDPKAPEQAPDK